MIDTKTKEQLNAQLQKVRALLTSRDWEVWVNFLRKERRPLLQKKVNAAVDAKDIDQAQNCKVLLDDCENQIRLFGEYPKNIESKMKGEVDGD